MAAGSARARRMLSRRLPETPGLADGSRLARAAWSRAARRDALAEKELATAHRRNPAPNAWVKRQHQSRSDWSVRL